MLKSSFLCLLFVCVFALCKANSILIPMDDSQKNHLKAYGMAFMILKKDLSVDWLLNYRGGSFLITYSTFLENECKVRGISYELLPTAKANAIIEEIAGTDVNMS